MSRPVLAIACIALLAACQQTGQSGQQTVSHLIPGSTQASSARTASSARVIVPPDTYLPLSRVTFSCRLPVLSGGQFSVGYDINGGFITFPQASYKADPAGVIVPTGDGDLVTKASPVLSGFGNPFYDLRMKRWVPISPDVTSPDGSAYVLLYPPLGGYGPETSVELEVVSVATSADRSVKFPKPPDSGFWRALDFDGRYVLLTSTSYGGAGNGIWRLDTTTRALVKLSAVQSLLWLRYPEAWVGLRNPADRSLPPSTGEGPFDTIARINLTTGAETTWLYRPGMSLGVLGLDTAGHPVVTVASASASPYDPWSGTLVLLTGPSAALNLMSARSEQFPIMQADGGRIWFGLDHGIWVWTQARGLLQVVYTGSWMIPAGRCV